MVTTSNTTDQSLPAECKKAALHALITGGTPIFKTKTAN
jgi:hypothetical protein